MLFEQLQKWEPISGLATKYFLDCIISDIGMFSIVFIDLANPKKRLLFSFSKPPVYLQKTANFLWMDSVGIFKNEYESSLVRGWPLFKIINSKQKKWMSEKAAVIHYKFDNFQHFVLIAENFVIEIVAFKDPIVTMISNEEEEQLL